MNTPSAQMLIFRIMVGEIVRRKWRTTIWTNFGLCRTHWTESPRLRIESLRDDRFISRCRSSYVASFSLPPSDGFNCESGLWIVILDNQYIITDGFTSSFFTAEEDGSSHNTSTRGIISFCEGTAFAEGRIDVGPFTSFRELNKEEWRFSCNREDWELTEWSICRSESFSEKMEKEPALKWYVGNSSAVNHESKFYGASAEKRGV